MKVSSFRRLHGRGADSVFALAVAAAALAGAGPSQAAENGLTLSHAWIRSIVPSRPAAAYFTLKNNGDAARALVSASSPACAAMMMHRSVDENGMQGMRPVDSVTVPAHGAVTFAPGGYHVMCMKPTSAMKPGKKVPVTLKFGDGGSMTAEFPVRTATGE